MRLQRLPLTYDECRARFRHAAETAGVDVSAHPISARGPHEQELTIDVAVVGSEAPTRALVVLSGVHGVEGFVGSHGQCALLDRLSTVELPSDVAVVLVHAVNPWGMANGRRQNESNVDLNRNWRRDQARPPRNEAYDELHPIACPDDASLPDADELLPRVVPLLADKGETWIRDALTRGQYHHPDGLHYGGDRTEDSCAVVERTVPAALGGAEKVLVVDLHTGHGPRGEIVLLSAQPIGSSQDTFLRAAFGAVEATVDNPEASTGPKTGQIANGLADVVTEATVHAVTLEVGTADDLAQLQATYQEQWVHNHGDPTLPAHREVVRRYRDCFTPDDPEWERRAIAGIGEHLGRAVGAVSGWQR